jgi:hypothetical protein
MRIKAIEANRFTIYVKAKDSDDYRMLERWSAWFTERGIPCVIKCTRSGYALYREGLLETTPQDPPPPSSSREDSLST